MGSNLRILTVSLPERTTPAPSFALVTPTSTCLLFCRSILVPCSISGKCRPACNCTQHAMYTNCSRLPTRFSIVQCCAQGWFSTVPTRCQDCVNEVPSLCQRGAEIVQCCAQRGLIVLYQRARCQDCAVLCKREGFAERARTLREAFTCARHLCDTPDDATWHFYFCVCY